MYKKILLTSFLFIFSILSMGAITLDTWNTSDTSDNDEVYGDSVDSIYVQIYDSSNQGSTGTITVSPAPPGFPDPTEGTLADGSPQDGYYEINAGTYINNNTILISPFNETTYTITVSISGSSNSPQSLQVKIDKTNPTISNESLLSATHGNYFTQGDSITLTCDVSDNYTNNIQKSNITADVHLITGNAGDTDVECDTFSGGTATWNLTGGNVSDGLKQVTIRVLDNGGNERNAYPQITSDNSDVTAVSLVSPADSTTTSDNTPTFSWSDIGSDETDYVLEIASDANFNNIVRTQSTGDGSTNTITLSSSISDGTYYWQVYGKDGVGHEGPHRPSETTGVYRTITVDTQGPAIVSVDSWDNADPTDNDEIYGSSSVPVVRLNLQEATTNEYTTRTVNIKSTTTGFDSTYNLSYEGAGVYYYLWNISGVSSANDYVITFRLEDQAGNPATDNSLTITIDSAAPGVVVLQTPADGAKLNTTTPAFAWQDLNSDEAHYIFEIDDNNSFSSLHDTDTLGPDVTSYNLPGAAPLVEGTTYYWRVYAEDSEGNKDPDSATIRSLTSDITGPNVVSTSPDTGETEISVSNDIEITMNEELDATTVDGSSVIIEEYVSGSWSSVASTVSYSYSGGNSIIKIQPSADLKYGIEHRVTITTDVDDKANNPLQTQYQFSFTTEVLPAVTNVEAIDFPKDTGGKIKVSYDLLTETAVSVYRVYYKQGSASILEADLGTASYVEVDSSSDEVIIDSLTDQQDYMVAVVAWTTYLTHSKLTGSYQDGPVQPLDDAIIAQTSTFAEIRPSIVAQSALINYSLYIKPAFLTSDVGFDKIYIGTENHTGLDISSATLMVDTTSWTQDATPSGNQFNATINSDTIEIELGKNIDSSVINSKSLKFTFKAISPSTLDTTSVFITKIEDSDLGKSMEVNAGNADDDIYNDNTLTTVVKNQIASITGEINPECVKLSTETDMVLDIKPTIADGNVGFDTIYIHFPTGYTPVDTASWTVYAGDNLLTLNENISVVGETAEVVLPLEINYNSVEKNIMIKFTTDTPASSDLPTGSHFDVFVDNSNIEKKIAVTDGEADGYPLLNNDTLVVKSGSPASQVAAEVQPYRGGIESTVQFKFIVLQQSNPSLHCGIDKFVLTIPKEFSNVLMSGSSGYVKNETTDFTIITSGMPTSTQALVDISQPSVSNGTVEIELGQKILDNNGTIEISLTMDMPDTSGEYAFAMKAGNRDVDDLLTVSAQDVDGDPTNNNISDPLNVFATAPAQEVYAELTPYVVKPSSTTEVRIYTSMTTGVEDSGVDKIIIDTNGLSSIDISNATVEVNASTYTVVSTTPGVDEVQMSESSGVITLIFGGSALNGTNFPINISFDMISSSSVDYPQGSLWEIYFDNSLATHPIKAQPKDLDSNPSNGNSLYLYTGYSIKERTAYSELTIKDSSGEDHFESIINAVKAGSVNNKVVYTIKPEFESTDIGINYVKIACPGHSGMDLSSLDINVGGYSYTPIFAGEPGDFEAYVEKSEGVTGATLEVKLGNRIYYSNPSDSRIQIGFELDAPMTTDTGVDFSSWLDYTYLDDAFITTEGDADAIESTDTISVITKESPVDSVSAEIIPVHLKPLDGVKKFRLYFKPTIISVNSGFNKAVIEVPSTYLNPYVDTSENPVIVPDPLGGTETLPYASSPVAGQARIYAQGNLIIVEYGELYGDTAGDITDYSSENLAADEYFAVDFYAQVPSVSDYSNNSVSDDGKNFKIYVDNMSNSLAVYGQEGDATDDSMSLNTLNVVCAPAASSVVAEGTVASENGIRFLDNSVIVGSTSNVFTFTIYPIISNTERGINKVSVELPAAFGAPDGTSASISINDQDVTGSAVIGVIGNEISYQFTPAVDEPQPIEVSFKADAPGATSSGLVATVSVDNTTYRSDSYFELTATQGYAYAQIETRSLTFNVIDVPARGALAEITPSTVFKGQTKNFTMNVLPDITAQDSGIDILKVIMPTTYSDLTMQSVRWGGSALSKVSTNPAAGEYNVSINNNEFIITSGDLITNLYPEKGIEISFDADVPTSSDIPDGKTVSGYIGNSSSTVEVVLVEGDAAALNPSDSLLIRTSSAVDSAIAEIVPSYVVKGTYDQVFDYYIGAKISTYAGGVDRVEVPLPDGFSGLSSTTTYFYVGSTEYTTVSGAPAAGEVKYELSTDKLVFTFNVANRLTSDSTIHIRFTADVPNTNIVFDFDAKLYDDVSGVYDTVIAGDANSDSTDWDTLSLSTASAELEKSSSTIVAELLQSGNWKLSIKLVFNTTMDIQGPTPVVKVEKKNATTIDFYNESSKGVWEGYVWLSATEFTGKVDLSCSNARDYIGNWVNASILSFDVTPGVAATFFRNPAETKLYKLIVNTSSELPSNYTIEASVRETGFSDESITLTQARNKKLYTGNYRIKSSYDLTVFLKIKDGSGTILTDTQYSMNNISAPGRYELLSGVFFNLDDSSEGRRCTVGKNLLNGLEKASNELTLKNEVVEFDQAIHAPSVEIKNMVKGNGLFYLTEKGWRPYEMVRKNEKIFAAAVFEDSTPPVIDDNTNFDTTGRLLVGFNDASFIKEARILKGSGNILNISEDTIMFGNIAKSPIIDIEAVDYLGNTTRKTLFIKAPAFSGNIRIYPNPVSNAMFVETGYAGTFDIDIFDVSGRKIYRSRNNTSSFIWDLLDKRGKSVANGVYFMKIDFSNGQEYEAKIVVLR